jgi:hypothetical protein
MWHSMVCLKFCDVSEEYIVSNFSILPCSKRSGCFFEIWVNLYQTVQKISQHLRHSTSETLIVLTSFSFSFLGWGETESTWYVGHLFGLFYQPRTIDDECGVVGWMRIGRGNRSTLRKPAAVPLYPSQIPHDLTCARTRAVAVRSRRLTAWAIPLIACLLLFSQ